MERENLERESARASKASITICGLQGKLGKKRRKRKIWDGGGGSGMKAPIKKVTLLSREKWESLCGHDADRTKNERAGKIGAKGEGGIGEGGERV